MATTTNYSISVNALRDFSNIEHSSAIYIRKAYNKSDNVIEVEFLVKTKGKTSTAGHYGKAVKGNFIRYLALNQVKSVEEFKGFSYDGFNWDGTAFVKEES